MAGKWTIQEDFIVCKYSYEHAWKNITVEQINELMGQLENNGFTSRSKIAVDKRVRDYQCLFRGMKSPYATSKHQQLMACKELESYGIIKIKYYGMPKKRYFKFDTTTLNKLYSDFISNTNQVKNTTIVDEPPPTETSGYPKFSGFSF